MSQATIHTVSSTEYIQHIEQLIAKGALTEAATLLNAAAPGAQDDPRLHMLGTRLAEAAGNAKGALDCAQRAVSKAPDWAPAVMDLASLLARQNSFDKAVEQARKAVELAPGDSALLRAAYEVAQRSLNLPLANEWLGMALSLAPEDRELRRQLANNLSEMGQGADALALLDGLISADPADVDSRLARAKALLQAGETVRALQEWDNLLAQEPTNEAWQFQRALAAGETPSTQPLAFVATLYDGLASVYDQHMVRRLRYQLPKQMAERLLSAYPGGKMNVLDLGCGTGLLGVCLGRLNGALVGVDASLKMIEQAARHGVYDKFHHANLLHALRDTPDGLYEVIAALDVFIYVGELSQAIPDAHRILVPGGQLVFSCESAEETEADLVLRASGRYAHKASHVQALCQAAGFVDVGMEAVDLRLERGQAVKGFLVRAQKAA